MCLTQKVTYKIAIQKIIVIYSPDLNFWRV